MAKIIDETGKSYGRLTVLKKDGKSKDNRIMWLCQCSCGNLTRVRGSDLRSGHTTSCGCYNNEITSNQIAGQKFNKLTAIEKVGMDKNKNALWKCRCDCGNVITTTAKSLKSGHKLSCGCDSRSQGEVYVENFLKLSLEFSQNTKLMTDEVQSLVNYFNSLDDILGSSMAMLGNTVFAFADNETTFKDLKIENLNIDKLYLREQL